MSDTPETQKAVLDSDGQWSFVLKDCCERLERERDEARNELCDIRLNLGEDAEGYTLTHAVCVLQNERNEAMEDSLEQARLLGMGSEREAKLISERDEARTDLEFRRGLYKVQEQCLETARRERDEAREKYATEATEHMLAINKVCNERDEAKEDLEHWKIEYEIVVSRLCGIKHKRDNGIIAEHEIIPVLRKERDEARDDAQKSKAYKRVLKETNLRQTERIRYLEGATNHACGTPLSVALRERDKAMEALIKIEDLFIDGTDIYADRESMGLIAREALGETK